MIMYYTYVVKRSPLAQVKMTIIMYDKICTTEDKIKSLKNKIKIYINKQFFFNISSVYTLLSS